MYRFIFFLLIIFISCSNPTKSSQHDLYNFKDYDQFEHKSSLLDSLYIHSSTLPNDSLKREYLFKIATRYKQIEEDLKFKRTINDISSFAIKNKDTFHLAKAFLLLGDYFDSKETNDSAYYYYLKTEKLYSLIKINNDDLARILLYKADILYNQGIYSEAEIATTRALQLLEKSDNTRLQYEANVLMSLILDDLKEYDTALTYYKKIPHLLTKLEQEGYNKNVLNRSWLSYHNNIGEYYNETNNLSEAKHHLSTALRSPYLEQNLKLKAMILSNYAYNQILLKADDTVIDSLYNSSYHIRTLINHKQGIASNKLEFAKYYLHKKDTIKAIHSLEETLNIALNNKFGYELKESLKLLSLYDTNQRNTYTSLYIKIQDSINQLDKQTKNNFARIEYETNKIEHQNTLLTRKVSYLILSILFIALLSFILFVLFKVKLKNKKLLMIQKEQTAIQQIQELLIQQQNITSRAIEFERQNIANDLHDSVINRLFTSRINLENLPSSNVTQKNKIIQEIKLAEKQIRDLSHNLHQHLTESKQHFTTILDNLVYSQKNRYKTMFSCSIDESINWNIFTLHEKTQLYLILQELLQNVNKHAQATKCMVFFFNRDNQLLLRVIDNGIGIDTNKQHKGIGYKSIYTRLSYFTYSINIQNINEMNTISILIKKEYN